MKPFNVINNNGEIELRIDGYIVADEDKWIYDWFGYPNVSPKDIHSVLGGLGGQPITVKINSYGGDVWSGATIYTELKDYKGNVTVKIEGLAASAASVVAMSGDKILMSPSATMMIHNAASSVTGDYNDMEKAKDFLIKVNETIANAYTLKTGMDKAQLLDLMNKETWLSVDDALSYGFVDEMMFAEQKLEPGVSNLLKQKAMNMYGCFNLPSREAIDSLKEKLGADAQGGEADALIRANALIAIEKNRY